MEMPDPKGAKKTIKALDKWIIGIQKTEENQYINQYMCTPN